MWIFPPPELIWRSCADLILLLRQASCGHKLANTTTVKILFRGWYFESWLGLGWVCLTFDCGFGLILGWSLINFESRTRLFVYFGWIFNSRSIHSAQFLVDFSMPSYYECYVIDAHVFLQAASKMEIVQWLDYCDCNCFIFNPCRYWYWMISLI